MHPIVPASAAAFNIDLFFLDTHMFTSYTTWPSSARIPFDVQLCTSISKQLFCLFVRTCHILSPSFTRATYYRLIVIHSQSGLPTISACCSMPFLPFFARVHFNSSLCTRPFHLLLHWIISASVCASASSFLAHMLSQTHAVPPSTHLILLTIIIYFLSFNHYPFTPQQTKSPDYQPNMAPNYNYSSRRSMRWKLAERRSKPWLKLSLRRQIHKYWTWP
jgi:hypothetical protein